ncbi:MAG: hypothetical protein LBQ65_07530, partial [Tannerellaceae bacterium]|nr:hypothetical protein [Tannerellaceae bacterium]
LCNQVTASPVYISSISDFIEAGGELKILLSDYSEKKALEVNPNLFRRLAYYISGNRNVQIRKCAPMAIYRMEDSEKKEIQFAVADGRAYRIEMDTKELRAVANFNDTEMAKTYTDIFDKQFIRAAEIDLLTPFKFHNVAAV